MDGYVQISALDKDNMKRIILSLAVFLFAAAAWGQVQVTPGIVNVTNAPSGPCAQGAPGQKDATGNITTCQGPFVAGVGTWTGAAVSTYPGVTTDGANGLNVAGGIAIGASVSVHCAGTDDYAAIQAALTSLASTGGTIQLIGTCNTSTHGHLTIASNETLSAYGATISGSPGGIDNLIQNTQYAQTVSRTCSDVVMTVGSQTITSATCAFTQLDVVNDSIDCIGAYAGGTDWQGMALPNDLHTTISGVASATNAQIADPPSQVSNPMTCKILTRDHDIAIMGGTWTYLGSGTGYAIKVKTINRYVLRGVTLYGGALNTGGGAAGTGNTMVVDATDFLVTNISLHGVTQNQDGVDTGGPLHQGVISDIRGKTGDNFVSIQSVPGCAHAGQLQLDCTVFGVVDGVIVRNLEGSSSTFGSGVVFYGNDPTSGTAVPMRNVVLDGIIGDAQSCITCISGSYLPGFLGGEVQLQIGTYDLIDLSHIYGYNSSGSVLLGNNAGGLAVSIGSLYLRDAACAAGNPIMVVGATATVTTLNLSGLHGCSGGTVLPEFLSVSHGSTVSTLTMSGLDATQIFAGSMIKLSGTVPTVQIDHANFTYTAAGANTSGLIGIVGGQVSHLSFTNSSVTHGVGSGTVWDIIAPLTDFAGPCAGGGCPAVITDVVVQNFTEVNASAFSDAVIDVGATVNALFANLRLANMTGCTTGTASGGVQVSNIQATSVSAGQCVSTVLGGQPLIVKTLSLTGQTAAINYTTFYTPTAGTYLVSIAAVLRTAGTGGTITGGINYAGITYTSPNGSTTAALNTITQSQQMVVYTSGAVLQYAVFFTAVTGSPVYDLSITVTRLQ